VAYRIQADLSLAPGSTEPLVKYTEMFTRRASKGQCVNQPYLGCREFAADFRLVTADTPPATPIADTRELGWMLHDLDFTHPADPQPRFFNAKMERGVVQVPPFEEARG
jgi:CRISPR-associated protein Cas5d